MGRNFELEDLEKKLRAKEAVGDEKEVYQIAYKILKVARRDLLKKEILVNHILENKGYPMNNYSVETSQENTGAVNAEGNIAQRKCYKYKNSEGEIIATVFEQNWFAGYGTYCKKGYYIGLLDD